MCSFDIGINLEVCDGEGRGEIAQTAKKTNPITERFTYFIRRGCDEVTH